MSKPANPVLRRRLLDLALEELGEKAPAEINMRHLASRSGVSATAIYYYFPSKEALFEAIKFEAMDELDSRVAAAVDAVAARSALERLRALCGSFVGWCLEKPHVARLLMDALPPREMLDDESMTRYYSTFFRAQRLLEEAMAEGSLSPRDAALEASIGQAALWGIVTQFWSKRVHPRFWDSPEPLVERFLHTFLSDQGETP
jgi:AcrR family transcriptional regulator